MKYTRLLLIDDDEVDTWLMQETIKSCGLEVEFLVIREGYQALQYLYENSLSGSQSGPDLIFLDLSLPTISGIEVLQEIKTNSKLRHIPVIILTHSTLQSDIELTYRYNASAHLNKPLPVNELAEIIRFQYLFKPTTISNASLS
jgi:CheY-like chemotaxis protein